MYRYHIPPTWCIISIERPRDTQHTQRTHMRQTFKLYNESFIKPTLDMDMNGLLDYAEYNAGAILFDAGQTEELSKFLQPCVGIVPYSTARKTIALDGKALLYIYRDDTTSSTGSQDVYLLREDFEDCISLKVYFKGSVLYKHINAKLMS